MRKNSVTQKLWLAQKRFFQFYFEPACIFDLSSKHEPHLSYYNREKPFFICFCAIKLRLFDSIINLLLVNSKFGRQFSCKVNYFDLLAQS